MPPAPEDVREVVVDEGQVGSGHLLDVVEVAVQPAVEFLQILVGVCFQMLYGTYVVILFHVSWFFSKKNIFFCCIVRTV